MTTIGSTSMSLRRWPLTAALIVSLGLAGSALVHAQTGVLTQLPGLAACISQNGTGGDCADGRGLREAWGVAISPDGENVYVASLGNSVAIFARDKATGTLVQLPEWDGCYSDDGTDDGAGGDCEDGKALRGARAVAVSPDGRHVYVVSGAFAGIAPGAVAAFARDRATGALTQLRGRTACISGDGSGGVCTSGRVLLQPQSVAVSPDGRNVYVGSELGLAIFARDVQTGILTQLPGKDGCYTHFPGIDDTCRSAVGIASVWGIAISPDGAYVYTAAFDSGAVAVFARDMSSGALTQLRGIDGCLTDDGSGGLGSGADGCPGCCTDVRGIEGFATSIAISGDGKSVHVGSFDLDPSGGVATFSRDKQTGRLTQLPGLDGCISSGGHGGECAIGPLLAPMSIALSPDGKSAYVASFDFSGVSPASGVVVLARNKRTGALTQLAGPGGCITEDGSGGLCTDGKVVSFPMGVAVSKDGNNVYVTEFESELYPPDLGSAIAAFARAKK